MRNNADAEFLFLLWFLAGGLTALSAWVAQRWVRLAQRRKPWRERAPLVLLAALALGTGMSGGVVLALLAEALAFPIGFDPRLVLPLWLGTVLACVPPMAGLAATRRPTPVLGCGLLLSLVGLVALWGWFEAAGFRPGPSWRAELLATAWLLVFAGLGGGTWVAHVDIGQGRDRRLWWALGGPVLVSFGLLLGHGVTALAAGLRAQKGSVYAPELPGAILGVLCGVVLPMMLALMALNQSLRRRRGSAGQPAGLELPRRRKRRHRIRTL
jgi:hypothetical protein